MKALNRAFEKAFAHSEANNNLIDLIACMGEELGCDRVSIFEDTGDGNLNNTYEWCKKGVIREQMLLQHIAIDKFDTWHDRLHAEETLIVNTPEELKKHDPDVYAFFKEQEIRSAMVTLLAFHGKSFGFCILENPGDEVLKDHQLIMPGIRYILSSMIYSRNLVDRLKKLGYIDTLTGAGNRISLQEHLEALNHKKPISIICTDVIGWDNSEGKIMHLEREQTLVRAGEILTNLFDEEHVFRVATGEFIIVENDLDEAEFDMDMQTLKGLLRENNLLASCHGIWTGKLDGTVDALIHEVHIKTEAEKKILLSHRKKTETAVLSEKEEALRANIDLPKSEAFFRLAENFLAELFEEAIVTVVVDINYFNLYNDIFGRKAGNIFLENIARFVRKIADKYQGISGYLGGDNFCIMIPTEKKDYHELLPDIEAYYKTVEFPDGFYPSLGVYFSDDRRETATTLYDRALTALSDIKGDYIRHINVYSAEMHHHQKEDKLLLMNVKEGLAKDEFIFYVQPQVHEKSGKIIGGEALVRWLHEGQLIPPGRFIPVLEKTGYIYAVDAYIWEEVAKWQKSLIERGIEPVPVSVNVSRVDFYFADIGEHFIKLIKKYDLDPSLIGIEITESAFTDNTNTILDAVKKLHNAGFYILMDDFGSGSSSLSMLHTMHLDVLKTDVQFMSRSDQDSRAISIVESVISMAHLIGMSVVTEGVETEDQKENLIALGQNYAQGFFFYRPMPRDQFEELITDPANVTDGYKKTQINSSNQLRFREMIKEGLVSESLLDKIIRASAIYKEENGRINIIQLNELYSELTGIAPVEEEMNGFMEHLDDPALKELRHMLDQANSHPLGGSEGEFDFRKSDGKVIRLKMRVFLLYTFEDHRLYLSTMG